MTKILNSILIIVFVSLLFFGCKEKEEEKVLTQEDIEYNNTIDHIRKQNDRWMKTNPKSPFNAKGEVEFHPLNYFEPDRDFIFKSKLYLYEQQDTIKIFGTKGEERTAIRYGYFKIDYENEIHKLNVYQNIEEDGRTYYSIWFTDETTNDETYGVGRYLNMMWSKDPEFVYTIDFNAAYNPYCAYSKEYSCAIPSKEDHLDFEVRAGEKKFHD